MVDITHQLHIKYMSHILATTLQFVAIVAFVDVMILMFMVIAIANGEPVYHVPFWDAQLRFVVALLTY